MSHNKKTKLSDFIQSHKRNDVISSELEQEFYTRIISILESN